MKKIQLLLFIIFISIVFFGCSLSSNTGKKCESVGGIWDSKYNECSNITQDQCQSIGGQYDNCASPCEHTDSDVCIMMCVQICKLK